MKQQNIDWQKIYHDKLAVNGFTADVAQLAIIEEFARIEREMLQVAHHQETPTRGFFSRFLSKPDAKAPTVKGLYVFGTVGRGKTFLMDMFCENIPFSVKRLHFHHFMKSIHDDLKQIKDEQNPLTIIAADFAKDYRILCLDEFMVTDITDAMLLYGLLRELTDRGVVIITTTNIPPDDLYKNGLQRERFVPAIALIKAQLVIHEISAGLDFRRLCLTKHKRFFSPLNEETQQELETITQELSNHLQFERDTEITINGREIPFVAKSQEVIWFRFSDLCEGYRSQLDYIELAKLFPVMVVSDIPILDEYHEDAAKRFLLLIDELYDQRIALILSSAVPVSDIYTGKKITFEFDRLQSRLFEMQSESYAQT